MRRVGAGTIAALLGLALIVSVASGQTYKPEPADVGGWWNSLWGGKPKEEPSKPIAGERPAAPTTDRAEQLKQLQTAYQRRTEVCDELRRVAQSTNNTALEEEANRLDEMAWKLYTKKSQRLLGAASGVSAGEEREADRPSRGSPAALRSASVRWSLVRSGSHRRPDRAGTG